MTFDLDGLLSRRAADAPDLVDRYLNPWIARMLRGAGCNASYVRARGDKLWDADGNEYLDLFSGYGVFLIGRNHPVVVNAIHAALNRDLPNLVQLDTPLLAGLLAEKLIAHAPWLDRVFFCNSGAETVEAALKFACATTGRSKVIRLEGGFHGLTTGALGLGENGYSRGYEGLLKNALTVRLGDLEGLAAALSDDEVSALIVEPVQGVDVREVDAAFLREAEAMVKEAGVLFVADEVQTGCGRCGPFLACERSGVRPDIVLLSKGLSGGLAAVGAVLLAGDVFDSVFAPDAKVGLHGSTFSKNVVSMAAALATLHVLEEDDLLRKGEALGRALADSLRARHPAIREVRAIGAMVGVELDRDRYPHGARHAALKLIKDHRILAQPTGRDLSVLKLMPALNADPALAGRVADALEAVLSAGAT